MDILVNSIFRLRQGLYRFPKIVFVQGVYSILLEEGLVGWSLDK